MPIFIYICLYISINTKDAASQAFLLLRTLFFFLLLFLILIFLARAREATLERRDELLTALLVALLTQSRCISPT